MLFFDFIISTVYKFLLLVRKKDRSNIESICYNVTSLILFFLSLTFVSVVGMCLISAHLIEFNKAVFFLVSVIVFCLCYYFLKRNYSETFTEVVAQYDQRFKFRNFYIILLFCLLWFGSLFLLWGGLLYFRSILCR